MNVQAASLFFALLSLLALAGTGIAIATVLADRVAAPASPAHRWRDDLRRVALPLAAMVMTVTMLGSLYYSEIAGYTPCKLCWLQRICAYPLAVVLVIAAIRRDAGIRPYAITLAAIGMPISIYHSWIQWFPPSSGTSFCTTDAPCTERWVFEFGFVTLPFMALSAFLFTLASMAVLGASRPTRNEESP
ncbi:MAG: disulfide bond formation protein B [Acidimicrobiales bacterium]|nr:disulfide bond formation protein B [Acidimicrobiales bacterium]